MRTPASAFQHSTSLFEDEDSDDSDVEDLKVKADITTNITIKTASVTSEEKTPSKRQPPFDLRWLLQLSIMLRDLGLAPAVMKRLKDAGVPYLWDLPSLTEERLEELLRAAYDDPKFPSSDQDSISFEEALERVLALQAWAVDRNASERNASRVGDPPDDWVIRFIIRRWIRKEKAVRVLTADEIQQTTTARAAWFVARTNKVELAAANAAIREAALAEERAECVKKDRERQRKMDLVKEVHEKELAAKRLTWQREDQAFKEERAAKRRAAEAGDGNPTCNTDERLGSK